MSIEDLISSPESVTLEFKEKYQNFPIAQTVCSFANAEGGSIIIGVRETPKGNIAIGIDENDIGGLKERIQKTISSTIEPFPIFTINDYKVEGKIILKIDVSQGDLKPYYLKKDGVNNGIYLRVGQNIKKVDVKEFKKIEHNKKTKSKETEDKLEDPDLLLDINSTENLLMNHRKAYEDVKYFLLNEDVRQILVLHGKPGSGKTSLAKLLAADVQIKARFSDGIFYVNLGIQTNEHILESIIKITRKINESKYRSGSIKEAADHLRIISKNKDILLLLDEVTDPVSIEYFRISKFFNKIIIITRYKDIAQGLPYSSYDLEINEFSTKFEELFQKRLRDQEIKKNATSDKSITCLEEDKLGFDIYSKALKEFVASKDTGTPLTIAIDGPWGSGKTSLMQTVMNLLNPYQDIRQKVSNFYFWLKKLFSSIVTSPFLLLIKIIISFEKGILKMISMLETPAWVSLKVLETPSNLLIKGDKILIQVYNWVGKFRQRVPPQRHLTIWFNAWKFDQEEQLWAAIALEVTDQIKSQFNFLQRIVFWFRLTFKRPFWSYTLYNLVKKVLLPLLFLSGLVYWNYLVNIDTTSTHLKTFIDFFSTPFFFTNYFHYDYDYGDTFLLIGLLGASLSQLSDIVKDPFKIQINYLSDKTAYKDKIGFIGEFEKDFSRIVDVITNPLFGWRAQKLVIFIDDLDRCKPPKAVDIIEAINLFLDSKNCVFILGMDSRAVIASIETKYSKIVQKIRTESEGYVSPGSLFLDKIIQVHFHVPTPTKRQIDEFVNSIIESEDNLSNVYLTTNTTVEKDDEKQENVSNSNDWEKIQDIYKKNTQAQENDVASYDNEEIKIAIRSGVSLLKMNPRQVKRFVNIFRLYVYIANERGMFIENVNNRDIGFNLDTLAMWTAMSIRWTEFIRYMFSSSNLVEFRSFLYEISTYLDSDGNWLSKDSNKKVMDYLAYQRGINKKYTSHWSQLPWDPWLSETEFLKGVKYLQLFWKIPKEDECDWLLSILTMTQTNFE